jgi:hypothetical protein
MPAISRVAVDDGPADILSVVLSSAWTCLHDTPENQKNQYFDEFIPNESILLDLAASHPVEFAAGLNEVLQSETPPTVDYFTTLPDVAFKGWGIYLIVLGKPGELYRVYIGSATNTDRGLLARWHEYDQDTGLPKYYKASLAEGFTVVHRGLLCWTPSTCSTAYLSPSLPAVGSHILVHLLGHENSRWQRLWHGTSLPLGSSCA